jgi:transmembrane sensor
MEEFEFNRLIEKYQHGLLTGKEKALIDQWFEALAAVKSPGGWTKNDKLNLKHKILQQLAEDKKIIFGGERQLTAGSSRSPFWNNSFRMAASILLLATLSYLAWQFTRTAEPKKIAARYVSASQEIKKIILTDGSIIWLKGSSSLMYPEEFTGNERQVTLRGEALFEVAKDPARPFIIQCGELITTVLGTSFNIKASEKEIEVVVLTGKVSLASENDKEGLIVLPNEKALYSMGQKQIAKVNADADIAKEEIIAAVATGTEYKMDFEDTRMEEVIRRIGGKFNAKVIMGDPKFGNCLITADFTGQSLERTLNMISQALGSEYEITDSTVVLTGSGCD